MGLELSGKEVLAETWAFWTLDDWRQGHRDTFRYIFTASLWRHHGDGSGELRKIQKVGTIKERIMYSAWFFCFVKEDY